jgi:hypothetical protein
MDEEKERFKHITSSGGYISACQSQMTKGGWKGRATAQAIFLPRWPGFNPEPSHMGFIVDKVALGHVSSEYFNFHLMPHIHLPSGSGTIGQLVADTPSDLSLSPRPTKTNKGWNVNHGYYNNHYKRDILLAKDENRILFTPKKMKVMDK